jgi:hypothetical protein
LEGFSNFLRGFETNKAREGINRGGPRKTASAAPAKGGAPPEAVRIIRAGANFRLFRQRFGLRNAPAALDAPLRLGSSVG